MNPFTPAPTNTSEQCAAASTASPEVAHAPTRSPRWATRLRRHLTLAFLAKLVLLSLLYFLFFSRSQRPHIDADSVADRLLSPR